MKQYAQDVTSQTSQSAPIPKLRKSMTRMRSGGFGFEVDDETRLRRFLILGTEGGSYYAGQRELTLEAVHCIDRLIEVGRGKYVVDQAVEVSDKGLAPKNDPALLALAMVMKRDPDVGARRYAADHVTKVARTFTHLTSYAAALDAVGERGAGWGRQTAWGIASWFRGKGANGLAYQAIKYRQRQGWTPKDVIRLSHVSIPDSENVVGWAVGKGESTNLLIRAFEEVQQEQDPLNAVELIRTYDLPWEAVPDRFAKNLDVQQALFANMPVTATLRQLGRLTALGLFDNPQMVNLAVTRLTSEQLLGRARLHPMTVYLSMRTYDSGRGSKGKLVWTPVDRIVKALARCFEMTFKYAPRTGKRILVGVDGSGSMHYGQETGSYSRGYYGPLLQEPPISGIKDFSISEAALALAWIQRRLEGRENCDVIAFDSRAIQINLDVPITDLRRLSEQLGGGSTDCGVPIKWAAQREGTYDAFVIYTDSESWHGYPHPFESLLQYRRTHNAMTKMVSVDLVSHGYSIAPVQDDGGVLTIAGFDASVPQLVSNFVADEAAPPAHEDEG